VPIALIWYWYTFFRDARRLAANPQPPPGQGQVTQNKEITEQKQATEQKQVAQEKPAARKDR